MKAVMVWLLSVGACSLLISPRTRNAGMLAVAGAIMSLFVHYDFATIPEARNVAVLLWIAAAALFIANLRVRHQGRTA